MFETSSGGTFGAEMGSSLALGLWRKVSNQTSLLSVVASPVKGGVALRRLAKANLGLPASLYRPSRSGTMKGTGKICRHFLGHMVLQTDPNLMHAYQNIWSLLVGHRSRRPIR